MWSPFLKHTKYKIYIIIIYLLSQIILLCWSWKPLLISIHTQNKTQSFTLAGLWPPLQTHLSYVSHSLLIRLQYQWSVVPQAASRVPFQGICTWCLFCLDGGPTEMGMAAGFPFHPSSARKEFSLLMGKSNTCRPGFSPCVNCIHSSCHYMPFIICYLIIFLCHQNGSPKEGTWLTDVSRA